jgi:hypothetical protein
MQFTPADLVGYGFAIAAILLAIVIHFRSELVIERLRAEIDKKNEALRLFQENAKKSFGSINDIAFGNLVRVKNFPAHTQGLSLQRESLVNAISAIRLITAREDPTFQGEYIAGGELGTIEDSPGCVDVFIVTPDLRPDIEEDDLLMTVARNLAQGRRYSYVVPHDIPPERPPRLADLILEKAEASEARNIISRLSVIKIPRIENIELFANGLITLYSIRQADEPSSLTTIGFDEVVLPYERRGSLWQRQPETRAKILMAMVQQAIKRGERVDFARQNNSIEGS